MLIISDRGVGGSGLSPHSLLRSEVGNLKLGGVIMYVHKEAEVLRDAVENCQDVRVFWPLPVIFGKVLIGKRQHGKTGRERTALQRAFLKPTVCD